MVRHSPVIPLKDNIPTRTFPIITMAIVFVNTMVFLMQKLYLGGQGALDVYKYFGLIPRELLTAVTTRWDLIPYNALTVFSSMFLHGGFFHILGNMLYLWIFGNNVEDVLGHKRFIFFYFISGIVAAAFQVLYDPFSEIPMVGASGAVSGVLGAYLVLFPLARVKTLLFIFIFIKVVEVPAILLLTIWFAIQVFFSYGEGTAWYAHIGGFIFGLVFVKLFSLGRRRK